MKKCSDPRFQMCPTPLLNYEVFIVLRPDPTHPSQPHPIHRSAAQPAPPGPLTGRARNFPFPPPHPTPHPKPPFRQQAMCVEETQPPPPPNSSLGRTMLFAKISKMPSCEGRIRRPDTPLPGPFPKPQTSPIPPGFSSPYLNLLVPSQPLSPTPCPGPGRRDPQHSSVIVNLLCLPRPWTLES